MIPNEFYIKYLTLLLLFIIIIIIIIIAHIVYCNYYH